MWESRLVFAKCRVCLAGAEIHGAIFCGVKRVVVAKQRKVTEAKRTNTSSNCHSGRKELETRIALREKKRKEDVVRMQEYDQLSTLFAWRCSRKPSCHAEKLKYHEIHPAANPIVVSRRCHQFVLTGHHADEAPSAKCSPSEYCSQTEFDHPPTACQQRSGVVGQVGCPPCPGSWT
jgi:hypothetical protein